MTTLDETSRRTARRDDKAGTAGQEAQYRSYGGHRSASREAGAISFVFYDCETTGVSRSFDQILQFAGVRVDHQLRELDSFEVRSRLLPHIAPSVTAIRANRIPVGQ